jgi:hypothetical protein
MADEVGDHGRLSWRLLESLFWIGMLPIFIIYLER